MYANLTERALRLSFHIILGIFLIHAKFALAENSSELAGFSAVWKLMSPADRERFVSGYLRGWKDASEFLDIASEYVRTNPSQAPEALAKLRILANLGDQKPGPLAIFIDRYYKDPENQDAPLSKAVSAARAVGVGEDGGGEEDE